MLSQLLTFEEFRNYPVIVYRFYQNTYQKGDSMYNARLWFARFIVAYALLIFTFLAYLYIFEPLEHIAIFGVSASGVPESINFLRAGPGALFLGMALFAAYGLSRSGRLHSCLWVLVIFNACVVAVRLFGIVVDGNSVKQLSELRNEGLSWLLFVASLVICPRQE
jgi:hypothetical protein